MASGTDHENDVSKQTRRSLSIIAATSVLCALGHTVWPGRVDQTVAMFLLLAAVSIVFPQITKFKGLGLEFEVRELKSNVAAVETAVGNLEKTVGPGSKSALASASAPAQTAMLAKSRPVDPDDPNKGQFGGKPEANGRKLSATIEPDAGPRSSRCRVKITVASTDPERPLAGTVKFHLHPTFGRWSSYDVDVEGNVAEDNIVSYGAFTIGVEADDGETRLELDLADVPGGTRRFYVE